MMPPDQLLLASDELLDRYGPHVGKRFLRTALLSRLSQQDVVVFLHP